MKSILYSLSRETIMSFSALTPLVRLSRLTNYLLCIGWDFKPYSLTCQVDGAVVRGLCQQHGSLQYFYFHASARQAVVTYNSPDEAAVAYRSLDSYVLAGAVLSVDFIPEADAGQLSSSAPTDLAASLSSIWASVPGQETSHQQSVWQSSASVWGASTGSL